MQTKRQFRNFARPEIWEDCAQEPTAILPAIQPPEKHLSDWNLPVTPALSWDGLIDDLDTHIQDLTTVSGQESETPVVEATELSELKQPVTLRKQKLLRGVVLCLCLLLLLVFFLLWRSLTPTPATPTIMQQTISNISTPAALTNSSDETGQSSTDQTIQVYILGAVKHPGVYTLPADARVYQLLRRAGGPLPTANLVALNLAAKLTDGQEIYVLSLGERLPASLNTSNSGTSTASEQTININTATEAEMEDVLHVSSTTAKKIIDYRTEHGPYTEVEQLLQVISQSIYDRIKSQITV